MIHMTSTRARAFVQGTSLATLALTLLATPAMAQDTTPAGSPAPVEEEGAIVVTGFRAALQSDVNIKKRSDQIVETVSAEDIGKLPDASIGESIARLPGVTSQRLNGRANSIAIRGFGPDFSTTLLNGREQTSTADNRGAELDQYPSEVVNRVLVYKSPTASLVGQGLVGTIDLRTIRPLDYGGKRVFSVGARGTYADLGALNAGSKEFGYRLNGVFVDQFADDTFGISLAASYVDEPYQVQEFNAWGYAGSGTAASPSVIGGSKSYVNSTQLKRLGINGTVQYRPAPEWTVTLDGFYSNFKDDQIKRGIELPLGFGAFGTQTAVTSQSNGFATAGTFSNVRGVIRNDQFQRRADLYSFGGNLAYKGDDGWFAMADVSWSRTDRNELSLESYAGTGYNGDDTGNGAAATIGFASGTTGTVFRPNLNYSDPNTIFLTDPLGWGGSRVQAGYYNNRIVKDDLKQYRAEFGREYTDSFISGARVGLNYTDRTKSLTPDEYFISLPGTATQVALPAQYRLTPTNLSYLGLGPILSYNALDLIANNVLRLERNNSTDIAAKAFRNTERLMTAYVQLDMKQELGAGTLTGNIGVQATNTEQKSTAQVFTGGSLIPTQFTFGDDYWDVLPSLNLSLRMPSNTVIRFAASRQIQRPRFDQMRAAIGYGIDNTAGAQPIFSGSGGNPFLRPYRANAVDLNLEQYFGASGFVGLQLFYKDIVNYIDNGRFLFDYTGFPLPSGQTEPPSRIGRLDAPVNTGGGKMYGGEIAFTLPLATFTSALDGFGVTGGVGYTETEVLNAGGNLDRIPGYSEIVANGTAYFEKYGFNTRVSARHRSSFLGDFTGFGGSPTRRSALKETIVDAQIGYDFKNGALNGLSLYVQGQNLTDAPFVSIGNNANQVVDYQVYGRRFLAGFTYKF